MRLIWKPKATKQLLKIGDRKIRERIVLTIGQLEQADRIDDCAAVKKLTQHRYDYRMRIGDWRVLIDVIEDSPIIIQIEEVKKRDERTY